MTSENNYHVFWKELKDEIPTEHIEFQIDLLNNISTIYGIPLTDDMEKELAAVSRAGKDKCVNNATEYHMKFMVAANGLFKDIVYDKLVDFGMSSKEAEEALKRNYWSVVEDIRSGYETRDGRRSLSQEEQNLRNLITKLKNTKLHKDIPEAPSDCREYSSMHEKCLNDLPEESENDEGSIKISRKI